MDGFLAEYKIFFSSFLPRWSNLVFAELKRNIADKLKRCRVLDARASSGSDGIKNEPECCDSNYEDNPCGLSNDIWLMSLEASLKSAYYMVLRYLSNHSELLSLGEQAAVFLFVREYCYGSLIRYNRAGEFNVCYGGISYNRKSLRAKSEYLFSGGLHSRMENTEISCVDFEDFLAHSQMRQNDFMFLDPPYDEAFSGYFQKEFTREDHKRLALALRDVPCKWMMVIKRTDFIESLYAGDFCITGFGKNYSLNFRNRNDRRTEHLIITNYPLPVAYEQETLGI